MLLLLAQQDPSVGFGLTMLGLLLGVIAVCIPRIRKLDIHAKDKKKKKR